MGYLLKKFWERFLWVGWMNGPKKNKIPKILKLIWSYEHTTQEEKNRKKKIKQKYVYICV